MKEGSAVTERLSVVDIIRRKRDGLTLESEEVRFLIRGYVEGKVPDYQMAAFLMAVYFRGLEPREMTDLTLTMARSGDMVDFGDDPRVVDKHSTGGVGDKTTLVLAPLVASAGAVVAKMSGRALGHTGGTIDKLESIPGFRTSLDREDFFRLAREVGAVVAGQTGNLVPADKLLYALRDVTATVESVGLIASSIMSKKIAGGARRLVLDVKTGRGAFMREREKAQELAQAMVDIGRGAGVRVVAVVTAMDQPLGRAVGNALEVAEAVRCLAGQGPPDLEELCVWLGAHMLLLSGIEGELGRAEERLRRLIRSGEALERFRRMVVAQGGDGRVADPGSPVLPAAPAREAARSRRSGWVQAIDALAVGRLAMRLGAGRERKEDSIDPSVGVVLEAKVGDRVEKGEVLGVVHARDREAARWGAARLEEAFVLGDVQVEAPALILETVG